MKRFKPILVEPGIYIDKSSGRYYERPAINKKRKWRALGTTRLTDARKVYVTRQSKQLMANEGVGESPYDAPKLTTISEIIDLYAASNYVDPRRRRGRPEKTRQLEEDACNRIKQFFDGTPFTELRQKLCDEYFDWRTVNAPVKFRITKGQGRVTVDRELGALNNALVWAVRCEKIKYNPLADIRPRYAIREEVTHCRETMPVDADAAHQCARFLFRKPIMPHQKRQTGEPNRRGYYNSPDWENETAALGWQFVIEFMTGLRTAEALKLRWDAKPGEPGHINSDFSLLHVRRVKKQQSVTPWVEIHPALREALIALLKWHNTVCPSSVYFFPSLRQLRKGKDAPLSSSALAHALCRYFEKTGVDVTSHGCRAYFVTVLRSQGKTSAEIAAIIGHTSGGKTVDLVYGGIPESWIKCGAPKLGWLPKNGEPAWTVLNESNRNVVPLVTAPLAEAA